MSKDNRKENKKNKKRRIKLIAKATVFWARRQGAASPKTVERFCDKLMNSGTARDEAETAIREARALFDEGDAHLFLCQGSSCKKRKLAKPARKSIKILGKQCDLRITETRCLGPCGHAPAAALRLGERCRFFVDLDGEKTTAALQSFIEGQQQAPPKQTSQLSPIGAIETGSALISHLEPLRFLLGAYHGEAYRVDGESISQRIIASMEAGGHALLLRLIERENNTNSTPRSRLYVIYWNEAVGELRARIHSDHGEILDGPVRIEGERVIIPDILPENARPGAVSTRRLFSAAASGIHFVQEISRGGSFESWIQTDLIPAPR